MWIRVVRAGVPRSGPTPLRGPGMAPRGRRGPRRPACGDGGGGGLRWLSIPRPCDALPLRREGWRMEISSVRKLRGGQGHPPPKGHPPYAPSSLVYIWGGNGSRERKNGRLQDELFPSSPPPKRCHNTTYRAHPVALQPNKWSNGGPSVTPGLWSAWTESPCPYPTERPGRINPTLTPSGPSAAAATGRQAREGSDRR